MVLTSPVSPVQPVKAQLLPSLDFDESRMVDIQLAETLSSHLHGANVRVAEICPSIRMHLGMVGKTDYHEETVANEVKLLLNEVQTLLVQTLGSMVSEDKEQRLGQGGQDLSPDVPPTAQEAKLADGLKVLVQELGTTLQWSYDVLECNESEQLLRSELYPLLDSAGQPMMQIVGASSLMLSTVPKLLGYLLFGADFMLYNILTGKA